MRPPRLESIAVALVVLALMPLLNGCTAWRTYRTWTAEPPESDYYVGHGITIPEAHRKTP
jgi:hypothetical protein